jgi:hypothetical protein
LLGNVRDDICVALALRALDSTPELLIYQKPILKAGVQDRFGVEVSTSCYHPFPVESIPTWLSIRLDELAKQLSHLKGHGTWIIDRKRTTYSLFEPLPSLIVLGKSPTPLYLYGVELR